MIRSGGKRILLFSYNPVPTSEYKTIEGSALRFWRMAFALQEKGYQNITVAVWRDFPQTISAHRGIKITNFDDNESNLKELTKSYDVIIVSAAMGLITSKIRNSVPPSTRVVVDAYSPLYVEFLTKSLDKNEDAEHIKHYQGYVEEFNRSLLEADNILIANENQKHFYRGVLGGICSLLEHDDSRFIMLPAMVEYDDRVTRRTTMPSKIRVLWFGGIYPWFDLSEIIDIFALDEVRESATLTIVGGANPFYPTDSKRYNGKYIKALERAEELSLIKEGVVTFEDWVEYDKRIELFNNFDVAISINKTGLENDYSFRLRIADMVGNGLPIITNGGDALGEKLIYDKVAFRVDDTTIKSIGDTFIHIINDRKKIEDARYLLRTTLLESMHLNAHIDNLITVIENNQVFTSRNNHSVYIDSLDMRHAENILAAQHQNMIPKELKYEDIVHISTKNLLQVALQRIKQSLKSRIIGR